MAANASAASQAGSSLLKGARKDPELYVLGVIMAATFSVVGFYFGRNPTSKTRFGEEQVNIAENSSPWTISPDQIENSDKNNFKYMYHPGGDYRNPPRKAPSALNSVIVPNVTLPKSLHERFNKYGKDNY
ncbi:hypothetical protein BZA77DRAFT_300003 [Pyronema omphalodes]|nr:hypothetical protein BZA77DRAFT_300003 [Pyronema omphalodes]